MEKSIERIKQVLEQKRKHNIELLNNLKEKSIIVNAEKEKQKRYFINKTSTFLNKKRKNLNLIDSDIKDSYIKNNDNNSYDIMQTYEDYDDYYEDFMNNSFMSNKIFNNLNFCRPERFSLNKNKRKKLSIKNEEEFTIKKTIKPKEISYSINISFESKVKNENNTPFGFISEKKNEDIKKKDKEISFFDINNEQNTKSLFDTPNNKEKSLFSSNIQNKKENKQKEEKEINNIDKKDISNNNIKEHKEEIKLFGDIERLNSIENKDKTLFGESNNFNKEKNATSKKEEKKEEINTSGFGLYDTTPTHIPEPDNKEKEDKKESNKNENTSLFNNPEKKILLLNNEEKKEKEVKKETIILPLLALKPEQKEKEKEKEQIKEKEDKMNKTTLFENTIFTQNKMDNDNTKKTIQENENKTQLFSEGLFNNNNNSLSNPLFQKKEDNININENKEEKKEKIDISLFNNDKGNNTNNTSSMTPFFNNNNEKINEEPKSNILSSYATGSLANKSNPFLNPVTPNNSLPNIFSAKDLNTNNHSLFNNSKSFNNNQQQQFSLFNNQGTNNGNMNVSSGLRDSFNNNGQNYGLSLFNNNSHNIFGAPNNNNKNSIFNFPSSGIGIPQSVFSNGSNYGSGFSLGKNIKASE